MVDGRVYVVQYVPGRAPRAFWVDSVRAPDADSAADAGERAPLSPLTPLRAGPGSDESTATYTLDGAGQVAITTRDDAALATAQGHVLRTLDAMDMAMCTLALRYLLDWWPPQFTGNGRAVVRTDGGMRLVGSVRPVAAVALRLPPGTEVVDLRWSNLPARAAGPSRGSAAR